MVHERLSMEQSCWSNDKEKAIGFEHVIHYNQGITSDHVIASGSFPVNFDFAKIEVESYFPKSKNKNFGSGEDNS